MRDLPSLHALWVFEAAARHESFTLAARELCLTHGAVSRQVRQLEDHLGVQLFARGHRRVSRTPDATALWHCAQTAFATLRDGVAGLQQSRSKPLVLSCEPTLTLRWLIPRLSRFERAYPDFLVSVTTGGGPIDLSRSGVDLALRRDDFAWPATWMAKPIMSEWVGPVCCPSLRRAVTRKKAARAITGLHSRTRPDAWSTWQAQTGQHLSFTASTSFDHFSLTLEAAVAGLGVVIAPHPLVVDDLQTGRLVAPLGFVRTPHRYVLLARRPFENDERAAALLAWLEQEARHLTAARRRATTRLRVLSP